MIFPSLDLRFIMLLFPSEFMAKTPHKWENVMFYFFNSVYFYQDLQGLFQKKTLCDIIEDFSTLWLWMSACCNQVHWPHPPLS